MVISRLSWGDFLPAHRRPSHYCHIFWTTVSLAQLQNVLSTFPLAEMFRNISLANSYSPILFIAVSLYHFYSFNILLMLPWEREQINIFAHFADLS